MKKYLWSLLTFLMVATLCVSFTSCGGDDDNGTNSNGNGDPFLQTNLLEAVDLGLSVRWANMNVGANAPWEYGGYYAWGECTEKNAYLESNYSGPTNRSVISGTEFDVATKQLQGSWRMPTDEEIKELIDNCTYEATTLNGIKGGRFVSKNGNSIFLPTAGWKLDKAYQAGEQGGYWSGTGSGKNGLLIAGSFMQSYTNWTSTTGMTIRAVTTSIENNNNISDTPDNPNNEEPNTLEDKLPAESKQFVGYWINNKHNNHGIDLFLNTDGTGFATSYTWYWKGSGNYGYTTGIGSLYWSYENETKSLTTTYGDWQFTVNLINEDAMAATRKSGNTNVISQSWYKASNLEVANYLMKRMSWIDSNGNKATLSSYNISEDDNETDYTFKYSDSKGGGTLVVKNPFTPKDLEIIFTGTYSGNVVLER